MMVEGYMVEVELSGSVLTMRGSNRVGRVALLGADHAVGEVSVNVLSDVESVEFRDASRLTNGRLTVSLVDGRRFVLNFRRKQAEGFRGLTDALGAVRG